MDRIRLIKATDYPVLNAFWAFNAEVCEAREMYPDHSSYVFERNSHILYCVGLYIVEGVPTAFAEGLIRNPNMKADPDAIRALQAHIEAQAKERGVKYLIAISKNDRLTSHHAQLGYNKISSGAFMAKRLGE